MFALPRTSNLKEDTSLMLLIRTLPPNVLYFNIMLAGTPNETVPAIGSVLLIPKDVRDLSKTYLPEPMFKSVVASVIAATLAWVASTLALTELTFAVKFALTRTISSLVGPAVPTFADSLSAEIAPAAIIAPVIAALAGLDFVIILAFTVGCITGLLAFSRLLKRVLNNYHDQTLSLLVGFMLGALHVLWPLNESNETGEITSFALWAVLGAGVVTALDKLRRV